MLDVWTPSNQTWPNSSGMCSWIKAAFDGTAAVGPVGCGKGTLEESPTAAWSTASDTGGVLG
jgi:hypothetical protein